jgi:predicted RNA polymerase sigma factor
MPAEERAKLRPWWDCAMANAYRRLDQVQSAIGHYSDAIALATNQQQRDWIAEQIETLERT